jgi:hypothetical protein
MSNFVLGIDLGKQNDYTTFSVVERIVKDVGKPTYSQEMLDDGPGILTAGSSQHVAGMGSIPVQRTRLHAHQETERSVHLRWLDRLELGTSYPDIVRKVVALLKRPMLQGKTTTVVDATGLGRPVVDMLREADVPNLYAISITGGNQVVKSGREYSLPKRDLAGILEVLLEHGYLKWPKNLPFRKEFKKELKTFTRKITDTGHDQYEHWRDGDHDDLVLSVALACWFIEKGAGGMENPVIFG